jgi:multiple sugar transport system substrate-binding protein
MKLSKSLLVSGLLATSALAFAACTTPAAPTPTAVPATEAPTAEMVATEAPTAEMVATEAPTAEMSGDAVTLKVMLVDYVKDKTDKWLEEEVVPAFQKDHPNVNVEFIYVTWGTLDETVQGYFAAGKGADIINLGSEYVSQYGDRLAPLNSYMDAWGELDQFVPATLDTVTWDGEVRGLPWLVAPRAVMCRTDILKEAGFDAPPATFDEAIEQAGKLTVVKGGALTREGFLADGLLNNWQEYLNLINSLGGTLYNDDGTPNMDGPEAKAALEFMYNRRKAILPDDTIAGLPEATGSRLATGEVGCQWGNLWGAPATDDALWDKITLSAGFTDPAFNSEPTVQVFNDWLAVPAYSEHIDEAAAFLQFLGSKENLNTYNEAFGSFPARKDAWYGYVDNPVMQKMGELMDKYGVGFADVRETAQFRDILVSEIDAYFADLQDLDTTTANIQEKYTQVLTDAGRIGEATTEGGGEMAGSDIKADIKVMLVDYVKDKTDKWLEKEVVPAFQEKYPNVNVEFIYVTWGTLDETVQGYFAAGKGADIINLGSEYVSQYGDRLAPLNSYMDAWGELDQFVPATLDTVTWDGEVRGLPWLVAPRAVMCRTDILKEAGFDAPPATFDEAIEQAGKLTVVKGGALTREGFLADGLLNNWQEYLNLINSLGGTLYNDDGTPNMDGPEAKAALEFMYNRRKAILPDDTIAGLPEATGSRLATGEVGCQWGNLWGAPATNDALWDKITLSAGFTDPEFNSEPTVQVFNDWLAVPAYSKNIEASVAFLQFLGSKENLNAYNEAFGSFPARKDAWYGYVDNPVMQKMGELMDQYGVGFADVRETAQFRDILVSEIDAYFADLQDLDTTTANIQEKYTQVLTDAGRIK